MDKLDLGILRELVDNPAASPAQSDIRKSLRGVAYRLGVSETSVRERVGRMRQAGMLKGWTPMFNPGLLGLKVSILWFDTNTSSKQALMRKLLLLNGVTGIIDYYGNRLGMLLFHEGPEALKREKELIARMSESDDLVHSELKFPEPGVDLTKTDYQILESLHGSPKKTYKEIGAGLGLSSRTVRRRIGRLTKAWALFAIPNFDPKKFEGSVLANLVVEYDKPQSKLEVDRAVRIRFGDVLISSQLGIADRGVFLFCLTNISKAKEVQAWMVDQPGVKASRVDVVEDIVQSFDWLRELIRRKAASQKRPKILESEIR